MSNAHPFDDALRSLITRAPRRSLVLHLLALAGLALPGGGAAKKKRKRRKRRQKLRRNAFGCVDVGMPCRGNDANCCSGICEGKNGKKDKSRCVAHNVGGCQPGQDDCAGVPVRCGDSSFCTRTTGNAPFCAGIGKCTPCTRDEECEALGFGPGAACIICEPCSDMGTSCNAAGA